MSSLPLLRWDRFPVGLAIRPAGTFPADLELYYQRLKQAENDIFIDQHNDEEMKTFQIRFRDFRGDDGRELVKRRIQTPDMLNEWLGISLCVDQNDSTKETATLSKVNPKCRFVYLWSDDNQSRLRVTRQSVLSLFAIHQVMPAYVDAMLTFSILSNDRDMRLNDFSEQTFLDGPNLTPSDPYNVRSGHQIQLCYSLKGVTARDEMVSSPSSWSLRHVAIHHQFDVTDGSTLWIVTKAGEDIHNMFRDQTSRIGREEDQAFDNLENCFRTSLSTHLLYCRWATRNWHRFLQSLENQVDTNSSLAIYGPLDPDAAHKMYKPEDIQNLQFLQEKVDEINMLLGSDIRVMRSLKRYYGNVNRRKGFPQALNHCKDDVERFQFELDSITDCLESIILRGNLLSKAIRDRKDLVSIFGVKGPYYLLGTDRSEDPISFSRSVGHTA
ncbi:hypothetical protein BT63DRAFT_275482 [Microthyrium microscopicum]|uniref:CorA-like transporter domain-containing protein n=1 Tax=Microthyrium microscopicum TaxID=703497 RepID=A0A6A6UBB7_9PEZI|nr:hypothetical protein BT63DRAFT_275482 [Microthyrium microscopicum]